MEISEGTQQNYILTPEAAAEPVFARSKSDDT
jgi:hypothetical protein